jgi:hypothetical protein
MSWLSEKLKKSKEKGTGIFSWGSTIQKSANKGTGIFSWGDSASSIIPGGSMIWDGFNTLLGKGKSKSKSNSIKLSHHKITVS